MSFRRYDEIISLAQPGTIDLVKDTVQDSSRAKRHREQTFAEWSVKNVSLTQYTVWSATSQPSPCAHRRTRPQGPSTHQAWVICICRRRYPSSGAGFPELLYRFDLIRTGTGSFVIYILLWPQILLSLCATLAMFFPPDDGRLGFCMTLFLSVQFLKFFLPTIVPMCKRAVWLHLFNYIHEFAPSFALLETMVVYLLIAMNRPKFQIAIEEASSFVLRKPTATRTARHSQAEKDKQDAANRWQIFALKIDLVCGHFCVAFYIVWLSIIFSVFPHQDATTNHFKWEWEPKNRGWIALMTVFAAFSLGYVGLAISRRLGVVNLLRMRAGKKEAEAPGADNQVIASSSSCSAVLASDLASSEGVVSGPDLKVSV